MTSTTSHTLCIVDTHSQTMIVVLMILCMRYHSTSTHVNLHMFHTLVLIYISTSLLLFHFHNPLFLYQHPNPNETDTTVPAFDGTTHTHSCANDSTKVPMTNLNRFVTTLLLHGYTSHCSQITTYLILFLHISDYNLFPIHSQCVSNKCHGIEHI
jgi:hypothetical protein